MYFFANKDLCPMKWSEPLIKWKMFKATLAITSTTTILCIVKIDAFCNSLFLEKHTSTQNH